MNNWPNQDKPGVPSNPEQDGWHWLLTPKQVLYPCWWNAIGQKWIETIPINLTLSQCWRPKDCTYFAPCLTPAEVAAQMEQARREGAEAMRETAAQYLLTLSASSPRWGSPEEHAEAIRALPVKEVTDA